MDDARVPSPNKGRFDQARTADEETAARTHASTCARCRLPRRPRDPHDPDVRAAGQCDAALLQWRRSRHRARSRRQARVFNASRLELARAFAVRPLLASDEL